MKFTRHFLLILLLSFHVSSAWATLCEKFLVQANAVAASKRYSLAHGEAVRLQFGDEAAMADAVFLGRLMPVDGMATDLAFYEPARQLIHIIPIAKTSIKRPGGEDISAHDTTPVVRSINQEGGTCGAFSMFNCLRQMHMSGQDGNEVLKTELATEAGRMGLLVRVVNQLYIENQGTAALITSLTTKYGFKTYEIPWSRSNDLQEGIVKYLEQGWPVLLQFDVSKEMSTTDYTIIDRSNDKEMSKNLWLPKGRLQFKKAGHMVTLVGTFVAEGRQKLLVSDPNFQVPRIWDLDELRKASSASIHAYVIWADKKSEPAVVAAP